MFKNCVLSTKLLILGISDSKKFYEIHKVIHGFHEMECLTK